MTLCNYISIMTQWIILKILFADIELIHYRVSDETISSLKDCFNICRVQIEYKLKNT
jgi:hypothetical protein